MSRYNSAKGTIFIICSNIIQIIQKNDEDIFLNQYEDSVEDEKANQEAFERSLHFSDDSKEDRFKKLSFLNNRPAEDPDDEFSLVKPAIEINKSPKIEIDKNFMNNIDRSKANSDILTKDDPIQGKSLLGKDSSLSISDLFCLDEQYQHKPIEFEKATEQNDVQPDFSVQEQLLDNKDENDKSILEVPSNPEPPQEPDNEKIKKRDEKAQSKANDEELENSDDNKDNDKSINELFSNDSEPENSKPSDAPIPQSDIVNGRLSYFMELIDKKIKSFLENKRFKTDENLPEVITNGEDKVKEKEEEPSKEEKSISQPEVES